MPVSVWLTTTAVEKRWIDAADPLLAEARKCIDSDINRRYVHAASPETADLVVFIEAEYCKLLDYLYLLEKQPLLKKRPNHCFMIDAAATFWALTPGIFTGLRAQQADRSRFRSGAYLRVQNAAIQEAGRNPGSVKPKYLATFRGADSAPVRARLFDTHFPRDDILITKQNNWCDYTTDQNKVYAREILESRFVLCPRGISPSSIRLFEVMRLERVPVILSDEWVPPDGPPWNDFSIRIAESRIREIPSILARYEAQAGSMGRIAREVWQDWFSAERLYLRMFRDLESIQEERPRGYDESVHQEWTSFSRLYALKWTLFHRAGRRLLGLFSKKP